MSLSEPCLKKRKLNDNTIESTDNINMKPPNDYNICAEVRKSCKMVYLNQIESQNDSKYDVWIDENAIDIEIERNGSEYTKHSISELQWRNDTYHYFNENDMELTLRFILVLDSLNFCFWPLTDYEYHHLGSGLKHTIQSNPYAFNPINLMTLTVSTLSKWLLSKFKDDNEHRIEIPLIEERTRILNEIGRVLYYEYDGKVVNFVKSCNGSALKCVELMTKQFRGFADHCIWPKNGKQIFLYKRAQIFVADVFAAYKGKSIGNFKDIDELTSFADYRVPQLLRGLNILRYSDRLRDVIDNKEVIDGGSRDEILIRASMICAIEQLKDKLNIKRRNKNKSEFISIEIDWCLWNRGEQLNAQKKLKPHHRTLTIYY